MHKVKPRKVTFYIEYVSVWVLLSCDTLQMDAILGDYYTGKIGFIDVLKKDHDAVVRILRASDEKTLARLLPICGASEEMFDNPELFDKFEIQKYLMSMNVDNLTDILIELIERDLYCGRGSEEVLTKQVLDRLPRQNLERILENIGLVPNQKVLDMVYDNYLMKVGPKTRASMLFTCTRCIYTFDMIDVRKIVDKYGIYNVFSDFSSFEDPCGDVLMYIFEMFPIERAKQFDIYELTKNLSKEDRARYYEDLQELISEREENAEKKRLAEKSKK